MARFWEEYYRAFRIDDIVRNQSSAKMISFIIGKSNLEAFLKDKNPERYLIFFREKYLSEEIKK